LRLDYKNDGVPKSMGGFDVPMKKGESLEYQLSFPDAGLFRYHPHVREDFQQEM
jgi:suppressor of ftsI